MGICQSTNNAKSNQNRSQVYVDPAQSSVSKLEKIKEKHSNSKNYIKDINNSSVIRKIREVEGQQVIIENCNNSTIIILDYSARVSVVRCADCHIYVGPCKADVYVMDCQNLKLIAACHQFRARNIKNVYLSLFVMSQPALEDCQGLEISCFNFEHNALIDVFQNAELNIWNNQWSEYNNFTPNNSDIKYFDSLQSEEFDTLKKSVLVDQEIVSKSFCMVPYTYGLSYSYKDDLNFNCLVFFDVFQSADSILYFCDPSMLNQEACILIKSAYITAQNESHKEGIKEAVKLKQDEFFNKEDFIVLWLSSKDTANFEVLENYLNSNFNEKFVILFDTEQKSLKLLIKKFFDIFNFE